MFVSILPESTWNTVIIVCIDRQPITAKRLMDFMVSSSHCSALKNMFLKSFSDKTPKKFIIVAILLKFMMPVLIRIRLNQRSLLPPGRKNIFLPFLQESLMLNEYQDDERPLFLISALKIVCL
jgi:hypothetical protein